MSPNEAENEVKALAKYLQVKPCKCNVDKKSGLTQLKHNGQTVCGLASIATFLVQSSGQTSLCGGSCHLSQAQIQQWLEYRVAIVDRCLGEKDVVVVLKELNTFLQHRVYFVGNSLSLADLLMYFGLYTSINQLTFHEKEKHIHLSRWFNNIQQQVNLEDFFPQLPFSLNHLYHGVSAH